MREWCGDSAEILETSDTKDGESDPNDNERGKNDGNTEEGVKETSGGAGDLFGISGGGGVIPSGIEEAIEEDQAGEEKNEGKEIGHGEKLTDVPAVLNLLTGIGEIADIYVGGLSEVFHLVLL